MMAWFIKAINQIRNHNDLCHHFRYDAYIDFLQQVFEGHSSEDQIPHVRQEEVLEPLEEFSLTINNTVKSFLTEQEKEQVFGISK